jgi:D-3-phosphoglycerate dehydrogenase / 2-oxoglutarate reductase
MKVLVIDHIHKVLQEILESEGHEFMDMSEVQESEIRMALPFADILVMRSRIQINAEVLESCPNLKIIARAGAGLEHIDVAAAEARGIRVLSSPEGNRQSVAEHAIGMLLALLNRIHIADRQVRAGQWERGENKGIELAGKTVGIIGYGNTGAAFSKVLEGFGVKILAYDRYKSGYKHESSIAELFESADVVSLHIPLSVETKYLVNLDWIEKFQNPIFLINTSRGSIVKTEDLLASIQRGKVRGACLDVLEFETENLKMPNLSTLPAAAHRLMQEERVILTPHTAGLSSESYYKLSSILAEKIVSAIT